MEKDSDSQDLVILIERYQASAANCRIFKSTLARYLVKLDILKKFLEKRLFPLDEDVIQLTELMKTFLLTYQIELSLPFHELSRPEIFHEISTHFLDLNQRILSVMSGSNLSPLALVHNPWMTTLDSYYDWYDCSLDNRNTSEHSKIVSYRPLGPRIRQIEHTAITLINRVETIPDYDDDDDEEETHSLPDCVQGYFALISQSPVNLKLICSDGCTKNNQEGLLQIAYTLVSIPRSDFLHRVLAVSTECSHLQSFRSEPIQPFPSNQSALGLISLLAPFGSLKSFLSRPPDDCLIDEFTSVPLTRSKGGIIAPDIKISILLDICSGLEYLHSQGYLHGRLHHNNILIFSGYRAKLTDYGIASQLSTPHKKYVHLTKTNEIEIVKTRTNKEKFRHSKVGNDPRWYAPEIVLKDISIAKSQNKSVSNLSSHCFGTIAV
jgi:hypothetical protein